MPSVRRSLRAHSARRRAAARSDRARRRAVEVEAEVSGHLAPRQLHHPQLSGRPSNPHLHLASRPVSARQRRPSPRSVRAAAPAVSLLSVSLSFRCACIRDSVAHQLIIADRLIRHPSLAVRRRKARRHCVGFRTAQRAGRKWFCLRRALCVWAARIDEHSLRPLSIRHPVQTVSLWPGRRFHIVEQAVWPIVRFRADGVSLSVRTDDRVRLACSDTCKTCCDLWLWCLWDAGCE